MTSLHMLCTVIFIGMIYAIGHWHYSECLRRRAWELHADVDRQDIRDVAEGAASEAASCAAVIDKIGTPAAPRRRQLHAVHDQRSGVATWHWE